MLNIIVGGVSSFVSRIVYEAEKFSGINILTMAVEPKTLVDNIERYIGGCGAVLLGSCDEVNAALLEVLVRFKRNFVPFIVVSDVYREGKKWAAYCAYPIPQGRELDAVTKYFSEAPAKGEPEDFRLSDDDIQNILTRLAKPLISEQSLTRRGRPWPMPLSATCRCTGSRAPTLPRP